MNKYDSELDTLRHIRKVNENLLLISREISRRAISHDRSKLNDPDEKEFFDKYKPLLDRLPVGSSEYKEALIRLKEGLNIHYANNRHHPEHFTNGISGMSLIDLIEMFADWYSVSDDMNKTLEIMKERFNIEEQLLSILKNSIALLDNLRDNNNVQS